MSKGKLKKFAEMEAFSNVFQYPYRVISEIPFELRGLWREQFFHNTNPIVVELGCGKGEYIVGLAKLYPNINFIGVDIKGARLYTGAKIALEDNLRNVAFLRTNIEIIDHFFSKEEVQEIWLTFSDPQMKNPRKRLTSSFFLERYKKFLVNDGIIHLKTDSNFLFTYTSYLIEKNKLPLLMCTNNLYGKTLLDLQGANDSMQNILGIQTYYEKQWMERGISIKYLKFKLPTDSILNEPDIEIELDEYRSFKRTKRSSKDKGK